MATIDEINRNSGAAAAGAGTASATSGAEALGRDDFMKLLVAQLRNQNPDDPVDTKELVTQLSQLTSVEQLIKIDERLMSLEKATNSSAANQSAGLIGKRIEGEANTVDLGATGGVSSTVNLSDNAANVTVSVSNSAGRVVRTFELPSTTAGTQKIEWNGLGNDSLRQPEGTYTFQVSATDAQGTAIGTSMKVSGVVTAVSYEHGYPELVMGTQRVPLSSVTSIGQ